MSLWSWCNGAVKPVQLSVSVLDNIYILYADYPTLGWSDLRVSFCEIEALFELGLSGLYRSTHLEPLMSSLVVLLMLLLLLETTSGREEQEMLERLEMEECLREFMICCACATMSLSKGVIRWRLKCGGSLVSSAPDFWGRGPGFKSGILINDKNLRVENIAYQKQETILLEWSQNRKWAFKEAEQLP